MVKRINLECATSLWRTRVIYDFTTTGEWQTTEFPISEMYPEDTVAGSVCPISAMIKYVNFTFLIANKRNEDFELFMNQVKISPSGTVQKFTCVPELTACERKLPILNPNQSKTANKDLPESQSTMDWTELLTKIDHPEAG